MKAVSLIIGAGIIILLMGAMLAGLNAFMTTDVEEPHNVTTGALEETAEIVLSQELYGDNTLSVTVTSNVTGDAPVPFSYTSSTRTLTVNGLLPDTSHRLTIDYDTDGLWNYPGASVAGRVWPVLMIVGSIGVVVGGVVQATRRGE